MGKIAVKYADKIIVTAEDPRTEKLDDIYKDIAAVGVFERTIVRKQSTSLSKLAKKGT